MDNLIGLGSPQSETQEKDQKKIHGLKCCENHGCKSYFICVPCRQIHCKKSLEKHLNSHPTKYPGVRSLDDGLEDIIELIDQDEEALVKEIEAEKKKGEAVSVEAHRRLEVLEREEAEVLGLVKKLYRKRMKCEASDLYSVKRKSELIASKLEGLAQMRARIHQDNRPSLEKIVKEHLGRAINKKPSKDIVEKLIKEIPDDDEEDKEDENLIIKQVKERLKKK